VNQEKFARVLRRNPTEAERALWGYLRHRPFGMEFFPQFPIGRWIADFYCPADQLVIEADGPTHEDRKEKDFKREQEMAELGIVTFRFSNEEILSQIEWIDAEISRYKRIRDEAWS
jgi:very-short-patch-repair endonuclease